LPAMKGPQLKRMTIVIAVCALVGALAGIAGSAAAPSKSSKEAQAQAAQAQKKAAQAQKKAAQKKLRALKRAFRGGPGPGPGLRFGFGFGPVHAEAVVPNEDGTGFITVTTDAGTLNSVDGTTLHVKEGTDKKVYKDDVAIDVGNDVTVIRNHEKAKLSDLKEGDHVRVITGAPKGNLVIAEDDAWIAQEKKKFREHGFRHHGFGPPGGPGGPPPGAPAPGDYPGGDAAPGTNS
jgi:type II secretory pathway pseudopilin PulG